MSDLSEKTAIVTGSTSGIGLEIARQLAAAGCRVMLHGINDPTAVETARAKFRDDGVGEIVFNHSDLSDAHQTASLIEVALKVFGTVDILVNNAGCQHISQLDKFSDANWDHVIEINLSAPFRLIKRVLPEMRKNGWGRIINIASVHGLVASLNKSAYVAAKHGLIGLTKATALETATDPITCNAICPGYVRTALIETQIETIAQADNITLNEAAQALIGDKHPSKSFICPSDIGAMVTFLSSNASAQITGSTFSIDGGWTAQ